LGHGEGRQYAVIDVQLRRQSAAQVCNLPDAGVPRVACLPNLQGLVAADADMNAAGRTRIYSDHFERVIGYEIEK